MVASYPSKQGRPVDPKSESFRKPWEKLGISRATFYWKQALRRPAEESSSASGASAS